MNVRIIFIFFFVASVAGYSLSRAGDAKAPAPSTQGDVMAFTAADREALVKMSGQKVSVEGVVSDLFDASPRVLLIEFKDSGAGGFVGVAFNDSAPKVHAHFEGAEGKALVGKTIQITGAITLYKGNPEIIITDLNQVEVVDTPSTEPSTKPSK